VARVTETRNAHTFCSIYLKESEPYFEDVGIWEDNIKMDLKDTGSEDTDWIYLAQRKIL
jgi:hypothetical protein